MHSHDRTMLAKLGFLDADKKNPHHDQACQYLTVPEIASKAIEKAVKPLLSLKGKESTGSRIESNFRFDPECFDSVVVSKTGFSAKVSTEVHLQKGEGKYATTIGFIDLIYDVELRLVLNTRSVRRYVKSGVYDGLWTESHYVDIPEPVLGSRTIGMGNFRLLAEVKMEKVPIGDVIRQIGLYRSYLPSDDFYTCWADEGIFLPTALLIATWDITSEDYNQLKSKGIEFIKLGSKFFDWAEKSNREHFNAEEV